MGIPGTGSACVGVAVSEGSTTRVLVVVTYAGDTPALEIVFGPVPSFDPVANGGAQGLRCGIDPGLREDESDCDGDRERDLVNGWVRNCRSLFLDFKVPGGDDMDRRRIINHGFQSSSIIVLIQYVGACETPICPVEPMGLRVVRRRLGIIRCVGDVTEPALVIDAVS